jgi:hypothetical protein
MKFSKIPEAPLAERLDCYRYFSAKHLFERAARILDDLKRLDSEATSTSGVGRLSGDAITLWHAFFAIYGKPFKQQRDTDLGMGLQLPEDIIPREQMQTHAFAIDLRDRMFMHTDFHKMRTNEGVRMSGVAIVMEKGRAHLALEFVTPVGEKISELSVLVDKLTAKVTWRFESIWKRWNRKFHIEVDQGEGVWWELNVDPAPNAVIVRRQRPSEFADWTPPARKSRTGKR